MNNTLSSHVESRAIYAALSGAGIGAGVGLLVFFQGDVSLFAKGISLGFVASIVGGLITLGVYMRAAYVYETDHSGTKLGRVKRHVNIGSLAVVHGLLIILFYALIFFIISESFKGAHIDMWGASLIVALTTGCAAYVAYLTAAHMNAVRVSTILALFLVSGTFISMLTASNPHWWNEHFSSLGAGGGVSGYAFNITLIIAGLVIVALSTYITDDFRRLKQTGRISNQAKSTAMQSLLAGIGISLALVGLFVYDAFPLIHNTSAFGMAFLFGVIIVSLPWLVPGFLTAFFIASYGLIVALVVSAWLFWGVGYFNLTIFELVAAAIIFTWLVIFVRHMAAMLSDEDEKSVKHLNKEGK